MNCKVCNKNLYKEMDLRVIFKGKYDTHIECESYIVTESQREVIPIEQNVIYFEYLYEKKETLNYEYLFTQSMIHILKKYNSMQEWSVIYFYEEEEYNSLQDESKYLLLNLGQKPVVFISMFAY